MRNSPREAGRAERVVTSAREPARRAARRSRSCLGATPILAPANRRPHQTSEGRSWLLYRSSQTSRLRVGLRGSSVEAHQPARRDANSCAVVCQFVPLLLVDAREQVLPRPAVPCPCAASMLAVMVVSIGLFDGRAAHATSNGRIRPEGQLRLDRLPARAPSVYFPCRQEAAFLARQITRLTPSFALLRG